MSDDLTVSALKQPVELWLLLDSFWRQYATTSTQGLIKYQTYANLILFLNNRAIGQHFRSAQNIQDLEPFLTLPWYPLVVFQQQIVNSSLVKYGEGYHYSVTPEIAYGEAGDPDYRAQLPGKLADIGLITDQLVNSYILLDKTQFTLIDAVISFSVDPFTIFPRRTTTDGQVYIVLWLKNAQFDLRVPNDQVGWVVGYNAANSKQYAESLRYFWQMILYGPNLGSFQSGMQAALGFPVVQAVETVDYVTSDTYNDIVATATNAYAQPANALPAVGTTLHPGDSLFDGLQFLEYEALQSVSYATLPGLAVRVPAKNGQILDLVFANATVAWTFDAGRDSPWRFAIGGTATDVEIFWSDVQAYIDDTGFDMTSIKDISGTINPMRFMVQNLMKNNIFVTSVDLTKVFIDPAPFYDYAIKLQSPATLLILSQSLGSTSDTWTLGDAMTETVLYGHASIVAETSSPGGSGIVFSEITPAIIP